MEAVTERTTYTGGESIAERINRHISLNKKVTIASVASATGYSRTTVSRYLAGKYDADATELEAKLTAYLDTLGDVPEVEAAALAMGKGSGKRSFYESQDARNVLGVCQSSQEFLGMGIVVGRSGYGKTHALKQYARLPRVAYVECDDTMSARDLVEAIERTLGLPSGYGTIWKRVNGIRDFFNTNRGYLLIIDEADKLVSKYTQKKMEILRAIFDQSDVGLVIAGEPKLEAAIKTYLARMANRVDFYASLRGLSEQEVAEYLHDYDIAPDALEELQARARNRQTGCFRLLDRTLSNVRRILAANGGGTITLKVIQQASGMMML
ncbi:AAA family ATPase [Intestinimonas butyriciproducens]|jgi:DNA transposition AAA+ family ATPase|uniref:AAA family ATPase n=1 Tax=Intestinimonas butyriciproducens TaxID=1297617 RepID=UPI001AB0541D|nr:AAA family ATPase [Intestinimonas butyriciproducens]MBO3281001.1 AAA family ATPase [Intestinimonas butyriciproducens]